MIEQGIDCDVYEWVQPSSLTVIYTNEGFDCWQVESVLDKEVYTLDELLDEDEIIQECKALNSRLINL